MTVKLTATHESYCTKTYILIADVIMNNITYVTVVPFPWALVYFPDGLVVCGGCMSILFTLVSSSSEVLFYIKSKCGPG